MSKKMLYAGSFDPVTNGHLDIIKRAATLTDELVVGVLRNLAKKSYFTLEERVEMIEASTSAIPNVTIVSFDGLLADYVNKEGIDVVLRGLRATTDFEYELTMAQMNAKLYRGGVETAFLMTDPRHSFISSSMIKEVFSLGGNIHEFVPVEAYKLMQNKLPK
jgi:pantetheine-phosphate adenylyltransferase